MKSSVNVLLGVLSLASLGAAGCHGDNCARAVTGTGAHKTVDISSRRSDCSSFRRTTITPEAYTSTVISTVYTDNPPRPPRSTSLATPSPATTSPNAVPSYASACVNAGEYSSACSCWGITAAVTTLPRPTTTATTTTYVNVGCKTPAICPFEHVNKYRCGRRGWCTCLREAVDKELQRQQHLCVRDAPCDGVKRCETSRDCGTGEGCVVNHCCGEKGPRICLAFAPRACNNPSRPRGIFERRVELSPVTEGRSEECTAFGCGQV